MLQRRLPLPIDPLIPEIVAHLRGASNLVLEAPPGAGKTTRVPPALLGSTDREILVLEPRRLAARLAARYVASELESAPAKPSATRSASKRWPDRAPACASSPKAFSRGACSPIPI